MPNIRSYNEWKFFEFNRSATFLIRINSASRTFDRQKLQNCAKVSNQILPNEKDYTLMTFLIRINKDKFCRLNFQRTQIIKFFCSMESNSSKWIGLYIYDNLLRINSAGRTFDNQILHNYAAV